MSHTFVKAAFIDRKKYRSLISSLETAPVYIYDWYLDAAADNWGALTIDDYATVLPLAFRKKFGISYFYQPFFTRNTVVAGKGDPQSYINILAETAPEFRYWDFSLDGPEVKGEYIKIRKRVYQQLILESYDSIFKGYAGNLRRSINSAVASGIIIKDASDTEQFVSDYRKYTSHRVPEFRDHDYTRLENILQACIKNATVYFFSAHKDEKVLASAFFAKTGRKIIYIEGFSSPDGRKHQAMHLLFDHLIKLSCNRGLMLDFGGSDVKSIAHFFHAFGGRDFPYYQIEMDRLPALVKVIRSLKR